METCIQITTIEILIYFFKSFCKVSVFKYSFYISIAINSTRTGQLSFVDKLKNMFSVELPAVDAQLLTDAMAQWREFWWLPTIMAGVIAGIFFVLFWDKVNIGRDDTVAENA